MCRLFGTIADSPVSIEDPILRGIKPFIKLSHKHHDGWGVGYLDNRSDVKSIRIVKSPHAAYRDEHFFDLVKQLRSSLIVAHLREAKYGEVSLNNTHPFYSHGWIFAHNGSIHEYKNIEKELGDIRFEGETDSERYFHLVLKHIRQEGSVRKGIHSAIGWLEANELEGARNFLMSNGRHLYAYRHGRDLFYTVREMPFHIEIGRIDYSSGEPSLQHVVMPKTAKMVMIASEALTGENWHEVPQDHLLVIDEDLHVSIEQVTERVTACC